MFSIPNGTWEEVPRCITLQRRLLELLLCLLAGGPASVERRGGLLWQALVQTSAWPLTSWLLQARRQGLLGRLVSALYMYDT